MGVPGGPQEFPADYISPRPIGNAIQNFLPQARVAGLSGTSGGGFRPFRVSVSLLTLERRHELFGRALLALRAGANRNFRRRLPRRFARRRVHSVERGPCQTRSFNDGFLLRGHSRRWSDGVLPSRRYGNDRCRLVREQPERRGGQFGDRERRRVVKVELRRGDELSGVRRRCGDCESSANDAPSTVCGRIARSVAAIQRDADDLRRTGRLRQR